MKKFLSLALVAVLAVGVSVGDAQAKRFGGGRSSGMQRSSPAMRQAPKETPNEAPKVAPTPTPASAANPSGPPPQMTPPKPSFMSRWGGVLAGLGMGALLGSMFGHGLGGGFGFLLLILLCVGAFLVVRMMSRARPAPRGAQFAGAGTAPRFREHAEPSFGSSSSTRPPRSFGGDAFGSGASGNGASGSAAPPRLAEGFEQASHLPPGFDSESFIRLAKTSFLRLQAANDAGDLADIRATTTPEMYAEIAMQLRERGNAPQHTEVVTLDAKVLETAVEGDDLVVSLRYWGTAQETTGEPIEAFDEVWHLRRPRDDPKAPWLIAGIQQLRQAVIH